ncbi:histone-like nucleoid-structuring protein, MvaT/MvaU family [Pseudomonas sp. SLFW]|uniref:histone-like nucleoid-structuring protein, MvaT/MvaU family n=1 Tax=Pseudomonas sp. SLFW TaxID=2683259 RepID=UPI0014125D78|nr:histone-like nucleoid-structuring protein, MvaT/MvaU family [Pseudomonas sp. SLFW]NBB09820.1 transcriptional regulator [Pseudomonas sp. SLFW]
MSKLTEFRLLEQSLAAQLETLEMLRTDVEFQKELEFETKLKALLFEYGKDVRDLVAMFNLQDKSDGIDTQTKGKRRARVMKVYQNPYNQQIVQSKGGNHRVLKQWKSQYGAHVVELWVK